MYRALMCLCFVLCLRKGVVRIQVQLRHDSGKYFGSVDMLLTHHSRRRCSCWCRCLESLLSWVGKVVKFEVQPIGDSRLAFGVCL